MRWAITWFCVVSGDIRLRSVGDFHALFSIVSLASLWQWQFSRIPSKMLDFEPIVARDTAKSSSNSAYSEQFCNASKKVLSYIARYPDSRFAFCTFQRHLNFSGKHSATLQLREDYSFTFPPLSVLPGTHLYS